MRLSGVSDILLPHVVRDTAGHHMHPLRADADETVERSEPRWAATVGREPEGQEACHQNGCRRGRHIRLLLVSDTGTWYQQLPVGFVNFFFYWL